MVCPAGRTHPCLWFDNQGEQAAQFYTEVFPDSRITAIARYGEAGRDIHGRPAGSVMTVQFELEGQPFLALNGGAPFPLHQAGSPMGRCPSPGEVEHHLSPPSGGGG